VKAQQHADAINTNIDFFISIFLRGSPVYLSWPRSTFRPQRTTVLPPNRLRSRMLAYLR